MSGRGRPTGRSSLYHSWRRKLASGVVGIVAGRLVERYDDKIWSPGRQRYGAYVRVYAQIVQGSNLLQNQSERFRAHAGALSQL